MAATLTLPIPSARERWAAEWTADSEGAPQSVRALVVLDAASADGRAGVELRRHLAGRRADVFLLWVIAPSEALSWAALAPDTAEERTRALFVTLWEQMARARRQLAPLQRALQNAGLPAHICVAHGPVVEAVTRMVVDERIDLTLIGARPPGVRQVELAAAVQGRTGCPAMVLGSGSAEG
jgi:hypothetical protein